MKLRNCLQSTINPENHQTKLAFFLAFRAVRLEKDTEDLVEIIYFYMLLFRAGPMDIVNNERQHTTKKHAHQR